MKTSIVSFSSNTIPRRERLLGDLPLDLLGQSVNPGDALPISPSQLVPTMLTRRELNYLHYLASQVSSGRIIEIGCFLGGSTRPLIAGYQRHNPSSSKMIVYDRFIAPNQQAFDTDPSLANYGLTPDQDFLPMFQSLHADHLASLVIMKGAIAEQYTPELAEGLYPEQEPVSLLFVDAAKSWGVHHTIANIFYPHMKPGGVLVHQDIGDFRTPWIFIHMYQLREFFEPLDRIFNSPTISFRCIATPSEEAVKDILAKHPSDFDPTIESMSWCSLVDYWSEILHSDASGLLSGYHATHALHAQEPQSTIHFAEQYDRWISSVSSSGQYISPDWKDWVGLLPDYLKRLHAKDNLVNRAQILARVHKAYSRMSTHLTVSDDWKTDAMKSHRWEQVEAELIEQGVDAVILFGAGRHTRWLIDSRWPSSSITIECIIDEHPVVDQIQGIPVCKPTDLELDPNPNRVVLPSSDAYESHLIERAQRIQELQGLPVWKVYTDTQELHATHGQIAQSASHQTPSPTVFRPLRADAVEPSPAHRTGLGLQPKRAWIDALAEVVRWPDWAQGHINESDSAFIWDIIEAVSGSGDTPIQAIEVGTASGVSTAVIALGLEVLASKGSTVDAFDILEHCYFDHAHRVGDAVNEIVSDLADRVCIHTGSNARDASKHFPLGQVQFVLIDADHRHPAAAMDLLALLPVLAPYAWVVLHDIELDQIQSNAPDDLGAQDGPRRLFQSWKYPKVRPAHDDPCKSNIGAIQMPANPISLQEHLLDLIEE